MIVRLVVVTSVFTDSISNQQRAAEEIASFELSSFSVDLPLDSVFWNQYFRGIYRQVFEE
jgi:hypothetical protein